MDAKAVCISTPPPSALSELISSPTASAMGLFSWIAGSSPPRASNTGASRSPTLPPASGLQVPKGLVQQPRKNIIRFLYDCTYLWFLAAALYYVYPRYPSTPPPQPYPQKLQYQQLPPTGLGNANFAGYDMGMVPPDLHSHSMYTEHGPPLNYPPSAYNIASLHRGATGQNTHLEAYMVRGNPHHTGYPDATSTRDGFALDIIPATQHQSSSIRKSFNQKEVIHPYSQQIYEGLDLQPDESVFYLLSSPLY